MSSLNTGTTVLVTGADGFIGSHLTETLVRQGYKVRAFVYYNSYNSWGWLDQCEEDVKGNFEVFPGDIRDPHGVKEAMKGCDAVLHLAALIAIPFSYHSPDTYIETNIKGTLNILQAARELGMELLSLYQLQKITHCKDNLHIRQAKLVLINWPSLSTNLSIYL